MTTLAELIESINNSDISKKEELVEVLMNYRNLTHEMLHSDPDDKTICKCKQCLTKGKPETKSKLKPRRKLIKKRRKT